MNVVEWHPEGLIDKRREGGLNPQERRQLDDHLGGCAACRFEILVADDLDDEDDDASDEDVTDLVLAVVRRREQQLEHEPAEAAWDHADVRRPRKVAAVVFVAAVLTSLTAAAVLRARANERAMELAPPPMHRLAPILGDAASANDVETRSDDEDDASRQNEEPTPSASAPVVSAADLFVAANAARRSGDRKRAIRLYQELQQRHPESAEAKLSHATLGKLLLDSEDPTDALESFDHYLEGAQGSLSEEALVGRAQALQRLGRKDEEKAAWRQLLAKFPKSIHAARARGRLAELARGE
jgi:TolA-binding protein